MKGNRSAHRGLTDATVRPEITRVREFLGSVTAGVATHFFLNIFAPRGFGKTQFLQRIWDEYEKLLPASCVFARSLRDETGAVIWRDLLVQILRELDFRLPRRTSRLPSGYEALVDQTSLTELVVDLILRATGLEEVVLLMVDDYDVLSAKDRTWFEARILGPLVHTRKVAAILTSELELRFTERIDLRMRLERLELSGWSAEAISHSFPRYEEIAPQIHVATGGLPLLTQEFIDQLEASRVVTAADFRVNEQELLRKYYRTHVEETILKNLAAREKETLLALASLRRFDVGLLRGVLPTVFPGPYSNYTTIDYLDLIEHLGSRVQWRLEGGYALNAPLRMVLLGYVQFERPQLHEQVNRTALDLYRRLSREEYREYYLLELLYHKLVVSGFERQANSESVLMDLNVELLEYLHGAQAASVSETDLVCLRNSLMHDADLRDYVSKEALGTFQDLIRARIEEHRVIPFDAASR